MKAIGSARVIAGVTATGQFGSILTIPTGCQKATWDIQGGDVFITFDGSTPSNTNGHSLPSGTRGSWTASEMFFVRAIRQGTTDGIIQITFWGY
jgi:hypothetical protein